MYGAIASAISVAALGSLAGWATMSPTSQIWGRQFCCGRPGSRQMALTYDDGPNDPWTLRFLELLAKHNARATFFVIGKHVRLRPDIVRDIVQAGHTIGNHTETHPSLALSSPARVRRELEQCNQAIADAVGFAPKWMRPPFGARRPDTLSAARSLGLEPVMWNITCFDWNATSAGPIVARIDRGARGGDIVLLHDGSDRTFGADRALTLEATRRILDRRAHDFVTIDNLDRIDAPDKSQ